jgi:hypothetical protein
VALPRAMPLKIGLLVRAGIALTNAFAAWLAWRNRPMDSDPQPPERTAPAPSTSRDEPEAIPAAHAACDECGRCDRICEDCDEPDTDVELADDEAPGPEQQFSGD